MIEGRMTGNAFLAVLDEPGCVALESTTTDMWNA